MANAANTWSQLSDSPFHFEQLARSPFMIHKLKITSGKWSKSAFGKYKDIKHHALCSSNDKKYLYIFEGNEEMIFIQMDIKTMQIVQTMKHNIKTGIWPLIIADPMDDTILHVVGGSLNNKHFTLNIKNGESKAIYTFDDVPLLFGGGIVFIQKKNTLLYFDVHIPVHSFNFKTKIWKNTGIKLPHKARFFGYILTQNEQFVVLFGGYDCDTKAGLVIFDIKQQTFKKSNIKTPFKGFCEAVLAPNGDIHLFDYNKHYVLNVNNILSSNDECKSEEKEENESEEKEERKEAFGISKVREWLCDCVGLSEYFDDFIGSGYDDMMQIKEGLNEEDLIDIGIHKRGHRKRILLFIDKLKESERNQDNMEGSQNNNDCVAAPNIYDTAQ